MARRMSVWPAAIHTRTPVGTPIIGAPKLLWWPSPVLRRRRRNAHANIAAEVDRECRPIRSRSLAPIRRYHDLGKPRRSVPKIAPPPINLPGNHIPQPGISRTEAPGANASATIDRFCAALQRRRRSGPDNTSTRLIAPSLAPVQATVPARCQDRSDQPTPARRPLPDGYLTCEDGYGEDRGSCGSWLGHQWCGLHR